MLRESRQPNVTQLARKWTRSQDQGHGGFSCLHPQLQLRRYRGTKDLLFPKAPRPSTQAWPPHWSLSLGHLPSWPSHLVVQQLLWPLRQRPASMAMPPLSKSGEKRYDRQCFSQTERLHGRWVTTSLTMDSNSKDLIFFLNYGKIGFNILNNRSITTKFNPCHKERNLFDHSHLRLRKKKETLPQESLIKLF